MLRTSLTVRLLAAGLMMSIAAPAWCGDVYWNNASGGSFSVAANWNPAAAPGATDVAWFLPSTNFDVIFDTSPTNQYLVYNYSSPNSNSVRLISAAGGSPTYHLTGSGGLWWNAGAMNVNSGILEVGASGQALRLLADAAVSVGGGSTLKVLYGSHVWGRNFFITALNGNSNPATVLVDGSGSQLITTGAGYINYVGDGSGSNAYLTLQNSSLGAFQTDLAVGADGATGHLTVQTGAGLTVSNNLTLGTAYSAADGLGAMTIASGAHVAVGHDLTLWNTSFGPNTISLTGGTMSVADVFEIGGNTGGSSTASASVTGGSLSVTNTGHTAAINVRQNGILTLNGGAITTDALNVDAAGQFNNISGSLTFTGQVAVNTGTLNLSGGTTTAGSNLTVGSASGASGQLNISNGATLNVLGGVLGVGNNGTLTGGSGAGTVTVANATVQAATILLGSTVGGSGHMLVGAGGHVVVAGGVAHNDLVVSGGTIDVNPGPPPGEDPMLDHSIVGGYLHDGAMTVSDGLVTATNIKEGVTAGCIGTLDVSGGTVSVDNVYLGGSESMSGGTGTLTVTGGRVAAATLMKLWNTSSSATVSNGGALSAGALVGPAGATVAISDSGGATALTVGSADSAEFAGTITNGPGGAGSLRKVGAGTQTLSGNNSYTGSTTVSEGTLEVKDHPLASPSIAVAANGFLRYNTAGSVTQGTTALSGGGTLTKAGGGTVTFGGALTTITWGLAAGAVIDVQGGWLTVGAPGHAENWSGNLASLNIAAGAVFQSTAANVRIDTLSGGGTLSGGYPDYGYLNMTVGVNNGSGSFSGTIRDDQDALNLVKTGSGTQILSGANTYTGLTTINGGRLELVDLSVDRSGAFAPVLAGGGASLGRGILVFDYSPGSDPAATIRSLLGGRIHSANAGCVWVCIDNAVADTVTVACTLAGDSNLDFAVNGADLNAVLSNYNQAGRTWWQGDFNGDGTVNGADLNTVLSNYNRSVSVAAAVPEPSAIALCAAGVLVFLARRRQ
jgi:fibronectin-binding autotransporter adhesin